MDVLGGYCEWIVMRGCGGLTCCFSGIRAVFESPAEGVGGELCFKSR